MSVRDVIIIGAGPSGLSAAIAARKHDLDYLVIEQGALVNSIYHFPPQMVFFTTPELLEIGGLPFVSPYEKPTRSEALKYYRKVVETYDLRIALGEKVALVARDETPDAADDNAPEGRRGDGEAETVFAVETHAVRGTRRVRYARNVIFAIGYYDRPNLLGVTGEDLPHVHHYYGDPHPYYRQRVVVVGGGNSAAESALELYRCGARVTLVHRGAELKSTIKYWVRPDIENRIKEGAIAARFGATIREIRSSSVVVRTGGAAAEGDVPADEEIAADAVFLLTGYRADSALMTGAGIVLSDRDAPVLHPGTFETNVAGLFVAGGAVAGVDTGTIFIENGRLHGETIIDVIAGRR